MEVRNDDEGWVFREIDPLICELLRILPDCAAPDDDAARKRIFTTPTAGEDTAADEDWHEYIEPELRKLFKSHTDIAAADIATMDRQGDLFTLTISLANARAWIHTLNQARLALAARHGLTEADTEGRNRLDGEKGFAVMQIDFYAMLLSLLLSRTEL